MRQKPTVPATPSYKIRWAIFLLLALLALAVRLPQLGQRPMHTDEAINAYITGELLAGEKYHYDPQDRHGPVLYLIAKPLAELCGARDFAGLTESELRLTPVIIGSLMILILGAAVDLFGFIPCLVAAILFAFAPLPVYYSRYFIHETLFVAATLGLILSGGRALKTNRLWPAAWAGLCAALMLAGKETAPLHFFALAGAALVAWFMCRPPVGTLVKTVLTAFVVFLAAIILLFTWGGQNWAALGDLIHAIPRFAARAAGEGHEKPVWYYLGLLVGGSSGAALLGLAMLGFVPARRTNAGIFLATYALLIFTVYSVIPYKTPWLALNFWLPFALLAGMAVEWAWHALPRFSHRCGMALCLGVLAGLTCHDTRRLVFKIPADAANPYAYAHTSEGVLGLPDRLAALARAGYPAQPRIAVVMADAWPLPWYLRKYPHTGFWQPRQETGPADFFITTTDPPAQLHDRLKDLQPEFADYFELRPNVLIILWHPRPQPKQQ